MAWETWLLFVVTEGALCLTPGPAVLFVVSQGLGRRALGAALAASLGIVAGNVLYFVLSATSLGAMLAASYQLFSAVRWLGAAYLIWLGVRMLLAAPAAKAAAPGAPDVSAGRLVLRGFLVQAANPKALVFFTALLPQFIDPQRAVLPQVVILGVTSQVIELAVLSAYGGLAARATALATRPRVASLAGRLGGALLVAAGLRLAVLRRTP